MPGRVTSARCGCRTGGYSSTAGRLPSRTATTRAATATRSRRTPRRSTRRRGGPVTTDTCVVEPIGRVESPLVDRAMGPKQGDEGAPEAWLVFEPGGAIARSPRRYRCVRADLARPGLA